MDASNGHIFRAAAIGSIAPQILRWYSQGSVLTQWESIPELLGWLTATALFILLAGYIAAYVWGERNIRKAFFIGVGIPSIIFSGGKDLASSLRPGDASGEPQVRWSIGVLEVNARGDPSEAIPDAKVSVTNSSGSFTTQRLSSPASFTLEPGMYSVEVEAAGHETHRERVEVSSGKTTRLTVVLRKRSYIQEYGRGFRKSF